MKLRIIVETAILAIFLITVPMVILLGRNVDVSIDGNAEAYVQRGNQLYREGRTKLNDASIQYWEAIKRDRNSADAHFKLAEIYYEYIWNYEALNALHEVERINPNYPQLYLLMGKVYHRMGDTNKAFESFQRAIVAQPEIAETYYYLGTIYQQQNANEDAIKAYEKAVTATQRDKVSVVKSYLQLGRIYKGEKDLEKAIETLKKALNIDPGVVEVIFELRNLYSQEAEIYKSQRKYDESAKKYEEILKIDPDNPNNAEIYAEIGSIYRSLELYDKAIAAYTAVTKLDPLNFDAFSTLKELRILKEGISRE